MVAQVGPGLRCEPWEFLGAHKATPSKIAHTSRTVRPCRKRTGLHIGANGTQQRPAFPHTGVSPPRSASGDGTGSQEDQRRGGLCVFSSAISSICAIQQPFSAFADSHSSTRRCPSGEGGGQSPIACRPDFVPSNARRPPVALVAPQSGPVCPPHWHPAISLATPSRNPIHPASHSWQRQARVGRLRWDEVGELDGLGALGGPTRTALSNARRLLRLLLLPLRPSSLRLFPTSSPASSPSNHLQPSPSIFCHICKRLYLTTTTQKTTSNLLQLCRLFACAHHIRLPSIIQVPSTVF